jgi:hypothetical protein
MPRKTADARRFKVGSSPERLLAPIGLTTAEKKIFTDLVVNNKPEHFKPSDLPLLVAYTHSIAAEQALSRRIAKDNASLMRWERACRVMNMLSHRLRLSPQSRSPTHSGARPQPDGRAAARIGNYFERMKVEGNGNGHDEHDDQ